MPSADQTTYLKTYVMPELDDDERQVVDLCIANRCHSTEPIKNSMYFAGSL